MTHRDLRQPEVLRGLVEARAEVVPEGVERVRALHAREPLHRAPRPLRHTDGEAAMVPGHEDGRAPVDGVAPAGAPRPVPGHLPPKGLVEHDVAPYAALGVLGPETDAVTDGSGVGDQLAPVEGDQLVDAEARAGGYGNEEVVAGAVAGDAEDGVDVGAGRDAGRGAEVAGHLRGTGACSGSEQRLLRRRRCSRARPYGRKPTSRWTKASAAEGELRLRGSDAKKPPGEARGGRGRGLRRRIEDALKMPSRRWNPPRGSRPATRARRGRPGGRGAGVSPMSRA